MRIGPDGIDPLHEPGKLILVSVSDDYQPDEDESRDSVEFGDDGSIVAVDGITGSLNIRVETDADQRRALLDHLLAAEGLPGVEEIDALQSDRECLSQSNRWREELEAENKRLRQELAELRQKLEMQDDREIQAHSTGYDDGYRMGRESVRLSELLEAEARERVEVTDRYGDGELQFSIGEEPEFALTPEGEIEPRFDTGYRLLDLLLCETAALAEKRRREGFEQ